MKMGCLLYAFVDLFKKFKWIVYLQGEFTIGANLILALEGLVSPVCLPDLSSWYLHIV